jgi:ribose-phosphate pyrophosphokinase
VRLFALHGSHALGEATAAAMGVALDPLEEREFEGGEHKSRPLVSVRGEDVYVLHALNGDHLRSPADKLLRLLFFIATCRENGAARVTAVAPYLSFMRKEQQTKPRDPVTTRYLAGLFEAVGVDMVVTIEPHSAAAFQNAFRCRTTQLDMRQPLAGAIARQVGGGRTVFVSPDSGGMKRAHLLLEAYAAEGYGDPGFAMMEKHRSGDELTGTLFAGDVADADVVIVDDMIATGGTVLRTAETVRARGARRVLAVATHGLFNPGAERLFAGSTLDGVIVGDTAAPFDLPADADRSRLTTVSCAPLLGEAIRRLHAGGSIHRLLNPRP